MIQADQKTIGRPRLSEGARRAHRLPLRLNFEEFRSLVRLANRDGISLAEAARRAILAAAS